MSVIDQLCPNCGLCCDSTLFADVELQPDDDFERLAQSPLALAKKGRWKAAFAQPCACFDGKFCKIYGNRPSQCRLFECGLLKRVAAGEMRVETVLKKISETKTLARAVRGLLVALGQRPDTQPLSQCYADAMSTPIELARGGDVVDLHGQLMQAYRDLMELVQRDFLR